ncbi:MAG: nucleotidyltransferase substrate binding protein [Bacteroidota bacterium]|nr:nucleotidyltransferase substrate binding protein [Bacteroidota bacterium]
MDKDIRWEQRFSNFIKALTKLKQSVDYINANQLIENIDSRKNLVLDEMLKEGLIQRFEYTHELAWNVMKDYAEYQGNNSVGGSKDATREAFQLKLITDGHIWMEMIKSRNQSSHTYNETTANEIYTKILMEYFPAFVNFAKIMEGKKSGNQQNIFE